MSFDLSTSFKKIWTNTPKTLSTLVLSLLLVAAVGLLGYLIWTFVHKQIHYQVATNIMNKFSKLGPQQTQSSGVYDTDAPQNICAQNVINKVYQNQTQIRFPVDNEYITNLSYINFNDPKDTGPLVLDASYILLLLPETNNSLNPSNVIRAPIYLCLDENKPYNIGYTTDINRAMIINGTQTGPWPPIANTWTPQDVQHGNNPNAIYNWYAQMGIYNKFKNYTLTRQSEYGDVAITFYNYNKNTDWPANTAQFGFQLVME